MTTDVLRLGDVRIAVRIGATAEERASPQPLELTLEVHLHTRVAGHTDDLDATIDYAKAAEVAVAAVGRKEWKLLEAAAEAIAEEVLKLGAKRVHVRLRKSRPPMATAAEWVEIEITRP